MPMLTRETVRAEVEALLRAGARQRPGPTGPEALTDGLAAAVEGRRSHRDYRDRPVPPELLHRVVGSAVGLCGEHPEPGDALDLYLAVREGDAPLRISEYRSGAVLGPARDRAEAARALARDYARAPVLVLIADTPGPGAAEQYGQRLVRAGALGYACWLAGRAEGLDGCVFGRSSSGFARLLRSTGRGSRHLFTVALGYAPATESGG